MYHTGTYFFSSSPLLSSSHLLTFSLLSSIPFPSVSFPNSCRYIYLYPFLSPPCDFALFALFALSILFLIPFSFIFPVPPLHFLISLSPFSFPSPLPFQPALPFFLPFPLLPLRLFSPFIFSSTVIHGTLSLSYANFDPPPCQLW